MDNNTLWAGMWGMGCIILANVHALAGDLAGFFLWLDLALFIAIMHHVQRNRWIRWLERRDKIIKHLEAQGFQEVKPKKKSKKK